LVNGKTNDSQPTTSLTANDLVTNNLYFSLFVQCVLAAMLAVFFEGNLFFQLFFVAISVIIHLFANIALERHEIVLRHKL